ncbi:MAG TPA: hypothetical protein VNF71_14890 [Acidimicrobiales bacterium]|nr:hypothetical protein [Acidimicrobiales bacterium]
MTVSHRIYDADSDTFGREPDARVTGRWQPRPKRETLDRFAQKLRNGLSDEDVVALHADLDAASPRSPMARPDTRA